MKMEMQTCQIVTMRGCVLNAVSLPYDSLLIQTSCLEQRDSKKTVDLEAWSWLDKKYPSTKEL